MSAANENIIDILLWARGKQSLPFLIEALNLSPRVQHSLQRDGIQTIGEVIEKWATIPNCRNLGTKGILEITDKLNIWYKKTEALSLSNTTANLALDNQSADNRPTTDHNINKQPSVYYDENLSSIPIGELDLSARAYNSLKRLKINTVDEVYSKWHEIKSLKNVGPIIIEQIKRALISFQNSRVNTINADTENVAILGTEILAIATTDFSQHEGNSETKSIYRLILPESVKLILRKNKIRTIDQLTTPKLEELVSKKIIGVKNFSQIRFAIQLWVRQDEKRENIAIETMREIEESSLPKELGFDDYFIKLFGNIKPRNISIVEFRYGLKTDQKVTLEETAKHFGVTRERVRQIESQSIETIRNKMTQAGQSSLFSTIKEIIDTRGGLISESRLLDDLRHVYTKPIYSIEGIMGFFNKVFDGEMLLNQDDAKITYLLTLSGWSMSSYDKDQILHTAEVILNILSTTNQTMQWSDLYSALIHEDGLITLDESLAHAIALCMSDTQKIQRQMDGGWSKFKKGTRVTRLVSVLQKIGRPVHFTEITESFNQIYPELQLSEHNLHALLTQRAEFVRVGQGKYGLPEWGLHDDGNVSNAVRRILVDTKFPMFLVDITNEVLKTWDVQSSAIISAIDGDARFCKTEDGKIWLTDVGFNIKKRIKRDDDTRWDRLLTILRKMGAPHSVQKIVEEHNADYPNLPLTVPAVRYMMYRKPEMFVRTGKVEFGLTDWGGVPFKDDPVDRSQEILKIFQEHSPAHITEIWNYYNDNYPEKQVSLITIRVDLKKLMGKVSTSGKGIYKLNTEAKFEVQQPE